MYTVSKPMAGHASLPSEVVNASDLLVSHFHKRMKLLIVDAEEHSLATLTTIFSTPLIEVKKASSATEAASAISGASTTLHAWIFDISLGNHRSEGLDIIEKYRQFPFVIIHSGIGSMEKAAYAIRLGVAEVIDKTSRSTGRLIEKTCGLLPLGMLCNGRLLKNRDVFFILTENVIGHHREWAERVNLSLRQLENICKLHTGLTPSLLLPLYYGIKYLLQSTIDIQHIPAEYALNEPFYIECIELLARKIEWYGGMIN